MRGIRACRLHDQLAHIRRLARPYAMQHLQQPIIIERIGFRL